MATLSKKKRFSRKKKRNISNKKKKRSQRKLKVGGTPGSLESEEYNIIDIIRDIEKIKEYLEKYLEEYLKKKVIEPNESVVLEENELVDLKKKKIPGLFTEEKTVQRTELVKKFFEGKRQELVDRIFKEKNDLQEIIKRVTKDLDEKKHYFRLACINPPVNFDFKKLLPTFLRKEEDDESDEISMGEAVKYFKETVSMEKAKEYFKETEESNKISILDYLFNKGPVTKKKLLRELFGKIIEDMFFKEKESIVEKLQYFEDKALNADRKFINFDKELFKELYNNLKDNFENDSSMTSQKCLDIVNKKLMELNPPSPSVLPPIVPPLP